MRFDFFQGKLAKTIIDPNFVHAAETYYFLIRGGMRCEMLFARMYGVKYSAWA